MANKTMKNPTVSVIMNCLNGSKYLAEAIDSIYSQTYKDWEIIFWDNASADNSPDIAKSYDERLRYFKGEKTVPLYEARNYAVQQANGKYIAFLDCDDMWLPRKLEWQVAEFEIDEKVGLVHTNVEILEGNNNIRRMSNIQPSGNVFRQLLRHYSINLQTAMISRAALYSLNEWFDGLLNHSGDTDLFLRIAHNWNVKYLPVVTARYREHGENRSLKFAADIPVELEYIIGKLAGLYRDFRKEYEMELIELRMRLQKGLAVAKWKSENGHESRKLALKHLASVRSFVLVYFLSFFPYKAVSFFRNLLRIR
ncbi:MAG: glycosyltransferase [Nitrospirae bacterium]|nr:glycosyltransferase [Nitrospirota bacterium]MBI3378863.1 glycosyltransferase [Nitrospirota bacterium]